ncbi:MAG: bifunctional precorrin-2 dehydrogenase/sirohydrochlorin ferrochelatase [Acidobacteria bacterium]|nr:bifunctional precorrin-2 dehydrogenase/sirohydrochlorin ferrochelatase [Acidobacteriota bacterium]
MSSAPPFMVGLRLEGRDVLVVGAGTIALRKTHELMEARARVTVVAPDVVGEFDALDVEVQRRRYRSGEAADYWFVVVATNDPVVNRAVFADGEVASVFVNAADDPQNCSAILPARYRQGDLTIAVSTNGRSPAMASWLKGRLGDQLGPEYDVLLKLLADERDAIISAGNSTEGKSWQEALDSGILELIRSGRVNEAREKLRACL